MNQIIKKNLLKKREEEEVNVLIQIIGIKNQKKEKIFKKLNN